MKYLIIRQQEADGCDYSIGCGIAVEWFETEKLDPRSELKQIEDHIAYPDGEDAFCAVDPDSEFRLGKAWAIPAQHVQEIDIQKLQKIHCGREEERERAETEAAERAEYERLRKKFGKPHGEKTEWTGEPHPEVGKL